LGICIDIITPNSKNYNWKDYKKQFGIVVVGGGISKQRQHDNPSLVY
jgi:hypothetical protein